VYFTLFIFHCEKHFSFDAGWNRRDECGANAGRLYKIDKNNRFANYKMQM
jgi:hypothetical protein